VALRTRNSIFQSIQIITGNKQIPIDLGHSNVPPHALHLYYIKHPIEKYVTDPFCVVEICAPPSLLPGHTSGSNTLSLRFELTPIGDDTHKYQGCIYIHFATSSKRKKTEEQITNASFDFSSPSSTFDYSSPSSSEFLSSPNFSLTPDTFDPQTPIIPVHIQVKKKFNLRNLLSSCNLPKAPTLEGNLLKLQLT
jgi:hypothetical protein